MLYFGRANSDYSSLLLLDTGRVKRKVKEPVSLEWTPCIFGGERPWFTSPEVACGRSMATLCGPGQCFLYHHCLDLRYESQHEDKKDRALRRAQKIRECLGGSANVLVPFPDKPKGEAPRPLRASLVGEHTRAEVEGLAGMREWLDKLERQIW
jgi:hypothetical protein